MVQHIGIVACSAEGAALCYQTICKEGKAVMGEHNHPEISMHTHPLHEYMKFIRTHDVEGMAKLMLSSAEKLQRCGADFCICPDNTIHVALGHVVHHSPLPWMHIAKVVVQNAKENEYKKLAILGTKYLMEGPVYPDKLAEQQIEYQIPDDNEREEINRIIFEELVYGITTKSAKDLFFQVLSRLQKEGCDAAILGCTEIPLLITPHHSPIPVLDSTRLLARAALQQAMS
jgi:aspartate racemase